MTALQNVLIWAFIARVWTLPQGDNYLRYDGHKVLRSVPATEEQRSFLREMLNGDCEVMKFPKGEGRPVDFLCPPEHVQKVEELIRQQNMSSEIIVHDMGEIIREQETPRNRVLRQADSMNWDDFQRYAAIVAWMEELATANPGFVQLIDMGRSVEGRKILALKIGLSPLGAKTRAIWIDGGIHAREWIAVSTASYIGNQLVQTFKKNAPNGCKEKDVLGVDWYLAPLLNPDGYEFTHTDDRLWRKNRQAAPAGSSCAGVDLNRNWEVIGYGLGASTNPCSETYQGTSKASEPETQAVANTFKKFQDNIRIYVSFHSYGQYWLTSWGYTRTLPEDYDKIVNLARKGVEASKCINPSRDYTVGSAGKIFYIAGGASDDWAKATAKVPYSFTIELPGGPTGFVIDKSEIIPVGNEMWAAMKEMAGEAARHPLGPDTSIPKQERKL